MERTISRIKNLKTRRKLSLPASPSPSYSASSIGSGGHPSPDSEIATSPCSSLATSPSVAGGGRMRRGGGGPSAARSGSLCVPGFSAPASAGVEGRAAGRHHRGLCEGQPPENESVPAGAQRTASERAAKKQWSPPTAAAAAHPHHPPPSRIRQPRRASVCGVGGAGGGGVVQHLMRYPMITTAAASPTSPVSGRYARRSDSVSTVEEEEDEMAAIRARVLGAARQQKGRGEASRIGNTGETETAMKL